MSVHVLFGVTAWQLKHTALWEGLAGLESCLSSHDVGVGLRCCVKCGGGGGGGECSSKSSAVLIGCNVCYKKVKLPFAPIKQSQLPLETHRKHLAPTRFLSPYLSNRPPKS